MSLSPSERGQFYRQLAALANAGVTPAASFRALAREASIPGRRSILEHCSGAFERGAKMSAVLREAGLLPNTHCAVVSAGEESGNVVSVLRCMAELSEHEWRFRAHLARELRTTKITMLVATPMVALLFADIMSGTSRGIAAAVLLILFAWAMFMQFLAAKVVDTPLRLQNLLQKTPFLRSIAEFIALSRLTRLISILYASGIPPTRLLTLAASGCGNASISARVLTAVQGVTAGRTYLQSLQEAAVLPSFASAMLNTGEETGNIDAAMAYAADHYQREALDRVHRFNIVLGAVTLLIVGALVGLIVAAGHGA